MTDKQIKVLIIGGAGMEGRLITKYLTERGATVVASLGRKSHLGEDIGTLAGIDPLGVKLESADDLEVVLERVKPDIAVNCAGEFEEIAPQVRTCINHNANVIMLAGDGVFPWLNNPELSDELNQAAKEHQVSLFAAGIQDVNWLNLAVVLSGNAHAINAIYGESWCLLDYCGPAERRNMGIGLSSEAFYELHKDEESPRSPYVYSLYQIAKQLGLNITKEVNARREPIFAKTNYYHEFVGEIKEGHVIGCRLETNIETQEGVQIDGVFVYTFAQEGDTGKQIWRFDGDPPFEYCSPDPRGDLSTSASVVNRLADVINACRNYTSKDNKIISKEQCQFGIVPLFFGKVVFLQLNLYLEM